MRSVKHGRKRGKKTQIRKKTVVQRKKASLRKKQQPIINNKILKKEWNTKLTAQQNLTSFGLGYDPNKIVGVEKDEEKMEVEELDLNTAKAIGPIKMQKKLKKSVLEELESVSENLNLHNKSLNKTRLSADDIRFCSKMIEKRALDYKAMERDSENIFQYTAKQIEQKINKFKNSDAFKKNAPKVQ